MWVADVDIAWAEGRWTHEPLAVRTAGRSLFVKAQPESDAWRHTEYGFVHDTEHALLAPLGVGAAMEVDFVANFYQQFDQAGIFVRVGEELWLKAGVEFADGALQAGAVVTNVNSDWSVAPVPEWHGKTVTIRASRSATAITLRIGVDRADLRLLRLVPFDGLLAAHAGPLTCAPTRAGLEVEFRGWRRGPADASLH
jgi:regulation of enolase protein 1 (concanavalin A-like superfamily)